MAINEVLNDRRLARRRHEVTTAEPPDRIGEGPDDPSGRDDLWRAVSSLPPRQRAVLVLRYYEDLSEQQIADTLGCRPGTVKSQASAALATLRTRLDRPTTAGEGRS
jgi:RNA polymerase sigma factor (sigma-70 family)